MGSSTQTNTGNASGLDYAGSNLKYRLPQAGGF
jgi:hypothetical protein